MVEKWICKMVEKNILKRVFNWVLNILLFLLLVLGIYLFYNRIFESWIILGFGFQEIKKLLEDKKW